MQPLVSFHSLCRVFEQKSGIFGKIRSIQAVRDVHLEVFPGRTLGVVGESGSGKSTLGRMAVGLLPPSSGEVRIRGESLYRPQGRAAPRRPAGDIQMIFQDPYSSLNPRMRVGKAVEEPLLWAGTPPAPKERLRRVAAVLEQVGLDPRQARRYPHEFSGGQRQRVAIARALITRPAFVVCDEPTSSLDASIQAQVLNLLKDMQDGMGIAYLFISHDLAVVRHMADRVAVLYRGMVVEEADARDLFRHPLHPYTRLLLNGDSGAGPALSATEDSLAEDGRDLCPFLGRCPEPLPRCRTDSVPLFPAESGRAARCLRISP
jgi:ABC-type oligopeptide transport system ATPase subunit